MIKPNNISDTAFFDYPVFTADSPQNLISNAQGKNGKAILINILQPSATPELMIFLEKILSAAKLNMEEDVVILQTKDKQQYNFASFSQQKNIQKAIFFGQNSKSVGLNINIQPYQLVSITGKELLFVDDLSKIQADTNLKKALWMALKGMFEV